MIMPAIVFLPILGAFVCAAAARRDETMRDRTAVIVTAAVFALSVILLVLTARGGIPGDPLRVTGIFAYGLSFKTDGFRSVYAVVTSLMWFFTTVFSMEYFAHEREHLTRYFFFVLVTLGATEGVMLSADFMTAFIFFELLSFTSFTWVIHEENPEAIRAGYTYLFIAVIGGLVLFMGLLLLQNAAGTLAFSDLYALRGDLAGRKDVLAASVCILFGFGAKAGMYPVHIWLPKAHPVAPSPGSALLSGVLTKVGIYGILMTALSVLPGNAVFGEIVLLLGVVTMALGAVLALFSVNLKRTLACSSMSQVGFILTGTGMLLLNGSADSEEGMMIAKSGLMLHMLNHSMIKLALFMAAGVCVMKLHTLDLNDLRGWGRNKLFLKISFALGALGISGVPLFNGYISKTLLHEGIVEGMHEAAEMAPGLFIITPVFLKVIEWIFLTSGGITFAYMLKLFVCIFVERNSKKQAEYDRDATCMNRASTAVIFGSALLCAILGQPFVTKRIAAFMTGNPEILEFRAFTWVNLKGGLTSLVIGGCIYLLVVRKVLLREGVYLNLWPEWLDLENLLYRPLLTKWLPGFFGTILSVFGENKVLRPLARGVVFAGVFAGRVLTDSLDAVIVFLRKTVISEKRVQKGVRSGRLSDFMEVTGETVMPISRGFSLALMMTCLGILIILGAVVVILLW